MDDNLTLGGGHTMQNTDQVSQKATLKTYIILVTNVTPITLIKNKIKLNIFNNCSIKDIK